MSLSFCSVDLTQLLMVRLAKKPQQHNLPLIIIKMKMVLLVFVVVIAACACFDVARDSVS
jgi:hypothetical protein